MSRAIQEYRDRSPATPCKLLTAQQEQLDIVMSWVVFHQPFFAHLLMAELPIIPTKDVPIAATDGFCIFINPDTFFQYSTPEQAFILCHEVLHCVFNDPILLHGWVKRDAIGVGSKSLKFDMQLIQKAMDYVINAQLIEGKVGRYNSEWLYDSKLSERGVEAQVDVYERLLKRPPTGGKSSFDIVLRPGSADGKPSDEKVKERDGVLWQQAIAAAAQAADLQGKLPSNFKKLIGEILEPKVSWQDHLRATMMRINGSDSLDWSQPDKRMLSRGSIGYDPIFFGRPTGFGAGTVVVGADSSGSMMGRIDEIMREVRGILEDINPREVVMMWCDAQIQRVDTLEELEDLETVRAKGAPGGGGTSFVPVFHEVEKLGLQPDMLVYLTDMYGEFPSEDPGYPVVWGSISGVDKAPFGEVVKID